MKNILNDFDNITICDTNIDNDEPKYIHHHNKHHKIHKYKKIFIKGEKGDVGLTGEKGDVGLTGEKGEKGEKGDVGEQGPIGLKGEKGEIGLTGEKGEKGDVGDKGEKGDVGLTGEKGEKGDVGLTGEKGEKGDVGDKGDIGLTGEKGEKGDVGSQGIPGQIVGIDSIFLWSNNNQNNKDTTRYQFIEFERVISLNGSWQLNIENGYNTNTTLVCQVTGYYMISYKVDVKAGNGNIPIGVTNCSTVIIKNNIYIDGSMTMIEAPETNHVYTLSNTILININQGDILSLLYWANDNNTRIGYREKNAGLLPNGEIPIESTANLVIIRIN